MITRYCQLSLGLNGAITLNGNLLPKAGTGTVLEYPVVRPTVEIALARIRPQSIFGSAPPIISREDMISPVLDPLQLFREHPALVFLVGSPTPLSHQAAPNSVAQTVENDIEMREVSTGRRLVALLGARQL